jgi:hypothetical protein
MDAYRRCDEFVVCFDLPGIDQGTIDLTVERNVLTIKAEWCIARREGDQVIAAERPHGAFTRQLFLGDTLDAERRPNRPGQHVEPPVNHSHMRTATELLRMERGVEPDRTIAAHRLHSTG